MVLLGEDLLPGWLPSLLSYLTNTIASLAFLLTLFYLWIRPKPVDPSIPGPKRHRWLGVTFSSNPDDGFLPEDDSGAAPAHFDWERWPTLSLRFSRRVQFLTWGGPTINLGFGGAFFNVVSPGCLEHILIKNFENYEKGNLIKSFLELFGEMAFTTDGLLWKFHRKIAVAILNKETVQQGNRILQAKLEQVEGILKRQEGTTVDFQDLSYRLIMDVFVLLGFGVDLNGVAAAAEEDTPQNDHHVRFLHAFQELQSLINDRFVDFFWEIKQRFRLGGRERRIYELTQMIDNFAESIIQEIRSRSSGDHNNQQQQQQQQQKDIITRFIQYCQEQKEPIPSNRDLRNMMMGFIMAGRDTTAASLSWTIYELNRHPEHLRALRSELYRTFSSAHNEKILTQALTVEALQKLEFLNAVVMESLRLHPTAPDNYRFSKEDDILPDGTKIPGGSLVMFSPYSINHCAAVWENPDEFDPTRFVGKKEPSPLNFPTFNAGPRTCPGRSLALMELKMCLAFLVAKFDFIDEQGHTGDYTWKLVMSMKGGFPVKIACRDSICD